MIGSVDRYRNNTLGVCVCMFTYAHMQVCICICAIKIREEPAKMTPD